MLAIGQRVRIIGGSHVGREGYIEGAVHDETGTTYDVIGSGECGCLDMCGEDLCPVIETAPAPHRMVALHRPVTGDVQFDAMLPVIAVDAPGGCYVHFGAGTSEWLVTESAADVAALRDAALGLTPDPELVALRKRVLLGCETCEFYGLSLFTDEDDYCDDRTRCDACRRHNSDETDDLYLQRLKHRGLNHRRTEYAAHDPNWGNIEKELAALWERECSAYPHSDLEWPPGDVPRELLRMLLRRVEVETVEHEECRTVARERVVESIEVTQEIATACSEVVQWFGSNCGMSFLMTAFGRAGYDLRFTKKERAATEYAPPPELLSITE